MPQVINTNVMSLNAQRNLSTSGGALATALQRLSSGLRINSAKDDAAGLAIAERFTTQIRGLNQAARNANDGISLAQTGEGALAEITNNLQRIRELAVQAANSTNSVSDRDALNQEVEQRLAEIERVASQTSFNGQKILDGSFGTAAFQVGANAGETISIGLNTSMKKDAIGQVAKAVGTINVLDINDDGTLDDPSFPLSLADDDFTIAVGDGTAVQLTGDYDTAQDLVDAINSKVAGASAWIDGDNHLVIASHDDLTIVTANDATTNLGVADAAVADDTDFLTAMSVETAADANDAIVRVDAALTSVSSLRSTLGAIQNRFESTITNLTTAAENLTASRSRIQDADFAQETAALTRAQILQQAGTAILAQANAVPQNVLSLLR
ncbi:MAG TPA: flagellin [Steroidobacteraceae bacterium]|jgi:flagellin|nr:flagellin [Steroidobacteraceae bacterium]